MTIIDKISQNSQHKVFILLRKCMFAKQCSEDVLEILHEHPDFIYQEWEDESLQYPIDEGIVAFLDCLLIVNSIVTLTFKAIWLFHTDGGFGVSIQEKFVRLTRLLMCLVMGIRVMESLHPAGGSSDIMLAECIVAFIKNWSSTNHLIGDTKSIKYVDLGPKDIATVDWTKFDESEIKHIEEQVHLNIDMFNACIEGEGSMNEWIKTMKYDKRPKKEGFQYLFDENMSTLITLSHKKKRDSLKQTFQYLNKIHAEKCIHQKRHRYVINMTKNNTEYKVNDEEVKNSENESKMTEFDSLKIDPPKPLSTGKWSIKNKKQWFTYDEQQKPITQQDIKKINDVLPSEMMTKFMNNNKQQIYNDAWCKIRGANAISYTNPILSKGVNYGTKIESMLDDFKEKSGVRLENLRQELNRRMGLVSFMKKVSIEKLQPIYKLLAKRDNMILLFDNRQLFESNNLNDKQQQYSNMLNIPSLRPILDMIKNQLMSMEAKNTAPSGIYIVIQMYLVHVKILKMLKRNKQTKQRPVKCNAKYKFDIDNWNTDTESDTDSDSDYDTD
eukprot:81769_1